MPDSNDYHSSDDTLLAHQLSAAAFRWQPNLLATLHNAGIPTRTYAVTSRCKSAESILNKVYRKVHDDKRPSYRVADVTDIIGIRVITLFRSDLLQACSDISGLIRDRLGVRPNHLVASEVIEATVHSTEPRANPASFSSRIRKILDQEFDDGKAGKSKVDVKYGESYSSIHLVVRVSPEIDGRILNLPIEIQLRTIFEDAWAQADHKLRYGHTRQKSDGNTSVSVEKHFVNLKRFLDASSEYCEILYEEMGGRSPGGSQYVVPIGGVGEFLAIAQSLGLPENLRQAIEALLVEKEEIDKLARGGKLGGGWKQGDLTIEQIGTRYAAQAERFETKFGAEQKKDNWRSERLAAEEWVSFAFYVLRMEEAYCRLSSGIQEEVTEAGRIYGDLAMVFPTSPFSQFRLGQCLSEVGDYTTAIAVLEKSIKLSDEFAHKQRTNSWLFTNEQSTYLQQSAYRLIGYAHWREFQNLCRMAGPEGDRGEAVAHLRSAWFRTWDGLKFTDSPEGKTRIENNLLYYYYEMQLLPEPHKSAAMMDMPGSDEFHGMFDAFMSTLTIETDDRLDILDTVIVVARSLGNLDAERAASKRVMDIANLTDAPSRYGQEALTTARTHAWETLKRLV